MKKELLLMLLLAMLSLTTYSQTDIYLEDFKQKISPLKCNDVITKYLNDSSHLKIKLYDCRGKMDLEKFDKMGNLVLKGNFENSLDTLKHYIVQFSAIDLSEKIIVHKYFEPLKEGVWIYYKDGKEMRREKYKAGILVKE